MWCASKICSGLLLFTLCMAHIGEVIRWQRIKYYSYADVSQTYAPCSSTKATVLRDKILECIDSIQRWMASGRLMLNPLTSEFIWYASSWHVHLIDKSDFILKDGRVTVSTAARNLGAFFDESLSMNDHVIRLARSSFYQLCRIMSIRLSLPTDTATQLVNSFAISRVNYCNSVSKDKLNPIQYVLSVSARLVFHRRRFDHVTALMMMWRWWWRWWRWKIHTSLDNWKINPSQKWDPIVDAVRS